MEEILLLSPRRFKEGGAAIFEVLNRNHIIAIEGRVACNPLRINKLREFIRS